MLDRDAQFDVASLSADPEGDRGDGLAPDRERVASFQLQGHAVDLELDRITLRAGLAVWMFSPASVSLVPQLARLESDSAIERHLPQALVEWTLLDTPVWRWIALAILAALLAPLSRLITRPVIALGPDAIASRLTPHLNRSSLQLFCWPVSPAALRRLIPGGEWNKGGPCRAACGSTWSGSLSLLFFLSLALLCTAVVDVSLRRVRTVLENKHQTFSYSALPLASRFLKVAILLLTIAAILSSWGYNTNTILAGLGVGGLAIALAAQKTIENLFGGVAVITDQPVRVGDFCRFGDLLGTVEDVGLRSTRVRTLGRTIVTVPNGEFSTMTLENFSRRDKMWFHITLNLRRDTQPEQVRTLLQSHHARASAARQNGNRRPAGALRRRGHLFARPGSVRLRLDRRWRRGSCAFSRNCCCGFWTKSRPRAQPSPCPRRPPVDGRSPSVRQEPHRYGSGLGALVSRRQLLDAVWTGP